MLLFYVDEYGDPSMKCAPNADSATLKDGVSEWFILSAVGVQESTRRPLAESLFEIKEKHFGKSIDLQPWEASEIKGRFLFRAARSASAGKVLAHPSAYAVFTSTEKVQGLVDDLSRVFSTYRPLIFAVAVDKKRLLKRKGQHRKEPLGAAYAYLEQRVALTVEKVYTGEGAMLVADQQTQHESYFRSGAMNSVREELTRKLPIQPNFNLVLDKPLWIDTDLSSWDREILQLSDIVAYSVAECVKRGEAPVEPCYVWSRIAHQMAVQWSTGLVEGGGFSIYPRPKKYPQVIQ